MGRERDLDEGDQVEAERLAREVGMITGNHLLLLQPHPPPRALRGRQPDETGELLVGEPAVILQRGQHFEVEGVHVDHAQITGSMHKPCMILAESEPICTHIAPVSAENPVRQSREIPPWVRFRTTRRRPPSAPTTRWAPTASSSSSMRIPSR